MASFCLIHGAWHDGGCWTPLIAALAERGHDAVAPDMPYHDPSASFCERVRPALDATTANDGLIVVGHSLGAHYAPLVAANRPGSVLVHLCPALVPVRAGFPLPPRRQDGTTAWHLEDAVDVMYRRLPADTAVVLAQRLRPMAPPPDRSPLQAHPDVPTTLLYAAHDEFFDPDAERAYASSRGMLAQELATGHFPMLEDPSTLADVLIRCASS